MLCLCCLTKYGILMYVKVIEEEKIQIYLIQAEFASEFDYYCVNQ
jgi:hypothetical protein